MRVKSLAAFEEWDADQVHEDLVERAKGWDNPWGAWAREIVEEARFSVAFAEQPSHVRKLKLKLRKALFVVETKMKGG